MNREVREVINKLAIPVSKFTIKNNVKIVDNKYVIKKNNNDDIDKVYKYLKSRSFDYFPELVDLHSNYSIYPFIEDINEPREQKAMDLIHLLSLLHSKTTFYREIDIDKNKEIFESINEEIDYLYNYYNDIITLIENEVYMSPSSYLIARNINIFFNSIYYVRENIKEWYKKLEDNKNERVTYIHNNISLDHYIKNEKPYLISWDKSKIDSPIYDLLSFYKNHYLELDFIDLFRYYEASYPLKEEERLLLFSYMAIPPKIEMEKDEYKMCIKINKIIDYMYKTSNLIKNYPKHKSK